jgi:hypothetical protein
MDNVNTAQVIIAHRLATAHAHEWAFMDEVVAVAAWKVGGWGLIEALTDANRSDWALCGISAPSVVNGVVMHTTGSRRLRWQVYEDGHTVLWVSRPSGDVLQASIWPDGRLSDATAVAGASFGPRHVEALVAACQAVAGRGLIDISPEVFERLTEFGLVESELPGYVERAALVAARVRAALVPRMDPAEVAREAAPPVPPAPETGDLEDGEPNGPVIQRRQRPSLPVGEAEA